MCGAGGNKKNGKKKRMVVKKKKQQVLQQKRERDRNRERNRAWLKRGVSVVMLSPPFPCFVPGSLLNTLRYHSLISWEQINSTSVLSSSTWATGLYNVLREILCNTSIHPPASLGQSLFLWNVCVNKVHALVYISRCGEEGSVICVQMDGQ